MVEMTMSFSKGKASETSISHNNRDKNFDPSKTGHKHIKSEYTELNEILVQKDIHQVYQDEFGEAVTAYHSTPVTNFRRIHASSWQIQEFNNLMVLYVFTAHFGHKDTLCKYLAHTGSQLQTC